MIEMNIFTKQKENHRHRKLMVTKGKKRGDELGVWNEKYTHYYIWASHVA